jgi:hypothetical protein
MIRYVDETALVSICVRRSVVLTMSLAVLAACGQDRQRTSASTVAPIATASEKTASPERAEAVTADPLPDNGHTAAVPADANAQTSSVAEALRAESHPERLSPLVAPPRFDPVAYAKDPAPYLAVTEPGRWWPRRRRWRLVALCASRCVPDPAHRSAG